MNEPQRCRLAVLASHPVQYFVPIYRELARDPRLAIDVLFCRDYGVRSRFDKQFGRAIQWDGDLLAGYSSRFLANVSPVHDTFNPLHAINPGAFTRLLDGYDALWVNGYLYPSNWFALAAAKLRGTRVLFRSELRLAASSDSTLKRRIRNSVLRWWVRQSDALIYIGAENRDAYRHYGAREDQLFFSPYSADVERLQRAAALSAAERDVLRATLGLPANRVLVLFVGKLLENKNVDAVVALAERAGFAETAHVVIAGTGPMEQELRERAARQENRGVTFLGFVNQSALPELYAIADVFVLPSTRETWGIVLNEAMAAATAPVVSDGVGAARDLIEHGRTGFLFAGGDWRSFGDHVERLVRDEGLRVRVARAAADRATSYSHPAAARGIVTALESFRLLPSA
jgi:glycosyltransferase involved in cell wall biosynthesis